MDNNSILSQSEQELITMSLIKLLNSFPELPNQIRKLGVQFYDMFPNCECLGIATLGAPKILKKYIGGSYIGAYNFRLDYRYSTKNPDERIAKQSLINTISDWLSRKPIVKPANNLSIAYRLAEYPFVSNEIAIFSIETVDFTVLTDKNKSGYEDSINDLILKYHYRKECEPWL